MSKKKDQGNIHHNLRKLIESATSENRSVFDAKRVTESALFHSLLYSRTKLSWKILSAWQISQRNHLLSVMTSSPLPWYRTRNRKTGFQKMGPTKDRSLSFALHPLTTTGTYPPRPWASKLRPIYTPYLRPAIGRAYLHSNERPGSTQPVSARQTVCVYGLFRH